MKNARHTMQRLVIALNNVDKIYYYDTAKIGVTESLLWLLYALDNGEAHSQREICAEWGFPKTTLNTTIKQAEAAGYVEMRPIPGKRREMHVYLTEEGRAYAHRVLSPVYKAEEQALSETVEKYSDEFIEAIEYFSSRLKSAFQEQVDASYPCAKNSQKK